MGYVFISYKSEQKDQYAVPVCRFLEQRGVSCWADFKDLPPGSRYDKELPKAVKESDLLLLLHSPECDGSEDVDRELGIAQNSGKTIISVDLKFSGNSSKDWYLANRTRILAPNGLDEDVLNKVLDAVRKQLASSASSQETEEGRKDAKTPIAGPNSNLSGVFTFSDLINVHGFDPYSISVRKIELDHLTYASQSKYKMFEDVEKTAEDWKDNDVECADASACLLQNGEIVAYIDCFPVSSNGLDRLLKEPFTDEYVEFYALGGNFDIYVSMFSFERKALTQSNLKAFAGWLFNRLKSWDEEDIRIDRICFSIYLDPLAKFLEALGFEKVGENELKGMLYMSTAKRLRHIPLFNSSILDRVKIAVSGPENVAIVASCEEIASSLHVSRGGPLHFKGIVSKCKRIIYAVYENQIVGYLALNDYKTLPDGIYLEQIAVKKSFFRNGIGSRLIDKAIELSPSKTWLYANVRKSNHSSNELFAKKGFARFEMREETYEELGFDQEDRDDQNAYRLLVKSID